MNFLVHDCVLAYCYCLFYVVLIDTLFKKNVQLRVICCVSNAVGFYIAIKAMFPNPDDSIVALIFALNLGYPLIRYVVYDKGGFYASWGFNSGALHAISAWNYLGGYAGIVATGNPKEIIYNGENNFWNQYA